MPKITRTFIKAGMFYFLLSLISGVMIEMSFINIAGLQPLFWHALMVGWITQIIFGVSLWMFPGRSKKESFQEQRWAWLTFIFLNTGLLFRFVSEPMLLYSEWPGWNVITAGSALLQLTAGITYVIEIWPRVLSKKQRREQRKKRRERK